MASLEQALMRDAYAWVNSTARNAAKEIMNGLAEAGPDWSGEFKDSWVAHAPSGGSGGGSYPYTLSDIPTLPATKAEAQRKTKFIIENVARHAPIALDLVDVPRQEFRYPGYGPQGDIVSRGQRPEVSAAKLAEVATLEAPHRLIGIRYLHKAAKYRKPWSAAYASLNPNELPSCPRRSRRPAPNCV